MYRKLMKPTASRVALGFVVICLASSVGQPLFGQGPDTWMLQISEKEKQLEHPDDPMWMKANMWDVSFQRMFERNMPYIELTNLQPTDGPDLTKLELTIGDTRFNFSDDYLGTYALLGATTPGFNLTSTANGGNLLTVNFAKEGGGGLAPGEIVRFKIDIDVDPAFEGTFYEFPDYRTVLFDMNGIQVYGPDPSIPSGQNDNATATVMFSNNTTSETASFIDEVVTGPAGEFFNDIFRPYGIMEAVDIFKIGAPNVIPEPSSGVLALSLIGGMWMAARRRRERHTG